MPVRIVEGQLPYTGGTGIEIDGNKVISLLLREENNLILVNDDNEIYTDLQLASGLTPQSDFPVGVTTGKVLEADGRPQSGLMLNWKTTSGDYARWIYCADGEIYFDGGNGVWRKVYYSSEVDALLQQLRNYVDLNFQPKLTAGAGITIDANNVISAQGAGTGDVSGPDSSTDGHLAVFDGTTGKAIKDGGPVPTQVTVVDNLTSTSTTSALSANQGKILNDKISTLAGLGKFLSLWDCTTGQPISFPYSTPYEYHTGDWYMINVVDNTTNYRPDGTEFDGTASSTVETQATEIGDVYIYDGTTFLLQKNGGGGGSAVLFSQVLGDPYSNTNLATALNAKQDELTAGTNIQIQNNVISATAGSDIVYATQAEYNALLPGAASDGKHYFIYSTSGGGGWQPGVNTIAYYPLTSTTTTSDESGNNLNLTNAGEAIWETVDGISCMYCNGYVNGTGYVYTTALTTPPTKITINIWAKASNNWTGEYARGLFDTNFGYLPEGNNGIRWEFYSGTGYPTVTVGDGGNGTPGSFNGFDYIGVNYSAIQSRTLWTITYDGENHNVAIYRNGILADSGTISSHIPTTGRTNNFTLGVGWRDNSVNRRWKGWISETILESKARTAQEIADYFNQTKANYGIS